jgi:DNA-binding response OmpR family regulator
MAQNGLDVLLVDDEEEFVRTLAQRLDLRGITCRVALNGESGLRMIEERAPDVVLLDLHMPGLTGLDVLERIRSGHPGVGVIMLTGHEAAQDGLDAVRLGAFDSMTKPLSIDKLTARISEAAKAART